MHTLTIGRTETGKTRLQQTIAAELFKRKLPVLVCDPMLSQGWKAHAMFAELGELVEFARGIDSAHIFVDESGQTVDGNDPAHSWLATTSRHRGHSVHFVAQRHTQLPPNMRNQCARLYCFRIGADDARQLSNEWAAEQLKAAAGLLPGQFVQVQGHTAETCRLDFKTGKIIRISLDTGAEFAPR